MRPRDIVRLKPHGNEEILLPLVVVSCGRPPGHINCCGVFLPPLAVCLCLPLHGFRVRVFSFSFQASKVALEAKCREQMQLNQLTVEHAKTAKAAEVG